MAQIQDIGAEQPEEHQRLSPLRRIPPEHANIFQNQSASFGRNKKESGEGPFEKAWRQCVSAALFGPVPRELPARQNTFAAMDRSRSFVEHPAHAGESQKSEEQDVAHQDQRKEGAGSQSAF